MDYSYTLDTFSDAGYQFYMHDIGSKIPGIYVINDVYFSNINQNYYIRISPYYRYGDYKVCYDQYPMITDTNVILLATRKYNFNYKIEFTEGEICKPGDLITAANQWDKQLTNNELITIMQNDKNFCNYVKTLIINNTLDKSIIDKIYDAFLKKYKY